MTAALTMRSVEPLLPTDADFSAFVAALMAAQLSTDDLDEPGRAFFRIRDDARAVGFGGYELHGEDALLRSVVILPGLRSRGLGGQVAEAVLGAAAEAGARHAWLLTATAERFFEGLGFVRTDCTAAPESIRSTRQAAQLCPSSATLMTRSLTPGA